MVLSRQERRCCRSAGVEQSTVLFITENQRWMIQMADENLSSWKLTDHGTS